MNVFISWSGARSKALAEALRNWLPRVLQAAKPWMSDEDISAGSRWLSEIQANLSETSLGIICVTPENQSSPWLLFEAGALSKALSQARVCPLLLGLSPSQLTGPLAQFQASGASKDGIERIVTSINKALGADAIAPVHLAEIIDVWWPKLEGQIAVALALTHDQSKKRPMDDILEEVVSNTREQLRRENIRLESTKERDSKLDEMLETMTSSFGMFQQMQENLRAFSGQLGSKPEDLLRSLTNSPMIDAGQMVKMFGSMKELSERRKADQENILKGPPGPGRSEV